MAEDGLVSVIVPTYNAAGTLEATLASARAQTHENLEILVVDDGSTDESAAIAERCAVEDARVRVLRKSNGGVAAARNFGLQASRGGFVAPLDADDLWHPTKIAKQLAIFEAADPATTFVYCLSYLIDGDDHVIGAVGLEGFEGDVFLRSLVVNFVGNGSAMLVRREAIDRIGGFDVSGQAVRAYGAEEMVAQSLLAALGPVGLVPERLVGYRRVAGSLSSDRARMENAQKWHPRRVKAAISDLPDHLVADAIAGIDARMAIEHARRGDAMSAIGAVWSGVACAPSHALAVLAAYGSRMMRGALRSVVGPARPSLGLPFADADPTCRAPWTSAPPFPGRLRALAAHEGDFVARVRPVLRAHGFNGVTRLGLDLGQS